jgi:hypothetical protein
MSPSFWGTLPCPDGGGPREADGQLYSVRVDLSELGSTAFSGKNAIKREVKAALILLGTLSTTLVT